MHLVVPGRVVLVGKQPDGDSVRFLPDEPALLRRLDGGERVHVSADGTVQLRFDGIDAPELHYGEAAQPRAADARDALLQRLGFTGVTLAPDGSTVLAATPPAEPPLLLAELVEINGRPVSVLLTGDAAGRVATSTRRSVDLTPALLAESVNAWMITTGAAYPLLYTSTPGDLRAAFRGLARTARSRGQGVWAADASGSFPVAPAAALGPGGVLVWPKLFRRALDRLAAGATAPTLPEWLAATPLSDDEVHLGPGEDLGPPVALHTLLHQTGGIAGFAGDVIEVTVVER